MKPSFDRLTSLLSRLRPDQQSEFSDLPNRIALVIETYENLNLNDAKRQDIFNLINGSLSLAEAMATDTYPAPTGVRWATHLIGTLCRVIQHLEDRPTVERFGLLCLETRDLHSETYATPLSASEAISAFRRYGATRTFEIVPVTVTSGHVVQPPPAPDLSSPADAIPSAEIPMVPETRLSSESPTLPESAVDEPIIIPRGVKPA